MGWKDIFSKRRQPEGRVAAYRPVPREAAERLSQGLGAARQQVARQSAGWSAAGEAARRFIAGYTAGFAAGSAGVSAPEAAAALRVPEPGAAANAEPSPAGLLLGRHEAQCGTDRLLRLALACFDGEAAPFAVVTACDTAADRLQTHDPQRNFRFSAEERAVLLRELEAAQAARTSSAVLST